MAAVNRPTLIIAASEDDINDYDQEAVFIYEHLGTADKSMITFFGEDHMMIYSKEPVKRMQHFAVAFFMVYLQGDQSAFKYFSEDFVSRQDGLAWGVVTNP